ncbi:hypothetical protein ACFXPX_04575 [Kitasatospora sp. NPDC059146]|uniref:hypothetical protein n=1 Tax=unclassified Kitasatospora TaxID=2633591 RepID=UPI0036A86375
MTGILLVAVLGSLTTLAVVAAAARRRARTEPRCDWCATQSGGWVVRGHDASTCRGYILDVRRHDPGAFGDSYRTGEAITLRRASAAQD